MNAGKNCLLFLFIFPLFAVAQSNYKPAYVVTLKGDTMRGFIDYREWDNNPDLINFRVLITSKVQKLTTDDISFFSVGTTESYQKYTGTISTDFTDPNHINNGRDSSFKTAAVFLKLREIGSRLTLYSYADDIKTRFFLKDNNNGTIQELIYRVYYSSNRATNNNQSGGTVDENKYLNQLFAFAQKYDVLDESFQSDLEHSSYNAPDISKLVNKINGVSKAEYNKMISSEGLVGFFIGTALNITHTTAEGFYQAAGGTAYTSYLPELSLGINIYANPNTQKTIFRVELIAAENQYKSAYIDRNSPYIPINYAYNQFSVALSPQFIYNFYNAENFKVYSGLGLAFTFYKYANEKFGSQDGKTPGPEIVTNNPFYFNGFSTPIMLKAGISFSKHWGIYGDYLTSSPISHDGYFTLNFTTAQAGINYFF